MSLIMGVRWMATPRTPELAARWATSARREGADSRSTGSTPRLPA